MKKHLLFFLSVFLLFCSSSFAQVFSKKDKLFGASAGISFSNSSNVPAGLNSWRASNIGLTPSIAWAIKNNVVVGMKTGAYYSRTKYTYSTEKNSQTGWQVVQAIFIRKYKSLVKNFGVSFTHELNGNYYKTIERRGPNISKSSNWGAGYSFIPAAFYKFSDRFIGEASFGEGFLRYSKGNTKGWAAGANFLTSLNIGVQYIIPGKKG